MHAGKGHVPEAGGLVPPGGTGNGVSCSQWNCTQGPGHTELHVRVCVHMYVYVSMWNHYAMYMWWCCRLGDNMAIKIADFGFSEKMYTRAYVRTVLDGVVKLRTVL